MKLSASCILYNVKTVKIHCTSEGRVTLSSGLGVLRSLFRELRSFDVERGDWVQGGMAVCHAAPHCVAHAAT